MFETRSLIFILLIHLLIEYLLTILATINAIFLIISLIIYICLILKEKSQYNLYSINYFSSIIFVIFHFVIFTLSYAEILPWETLIVLLLIISIIYYNKKLSLLTNQSYINW